MTKVLLFSGGLDSYIAAQLWQPDLLLYCRLGHRYERHELAAIARTELHVVVDDRLRLGDLERDDAIIPLRNLYLLAIATHYGDTVGLGALAGEVNGDKSEPFRVQLQAVLNTCYGPSYWSDGAPVNVVYPVAGETKVTLIGRYLRDGGSAKELVARTRTCYAPTELPCGWCSACVKRYIALSWHGISEELANDPHRSPHLAVMRERWGTYDEQRRAEVAAVFPEVVPS